MNRKLVIALAMGVLLSARASYAAGLGIPLDAFLQQFQSYDSS